MNLNEEQIAILKRCRIRLTTFSEIALKRNKEKVSKEMFEEAALINSIMKGNSK